MGRAKVVAHLGDARYQVELLPYTERVETLIEGYEAFLVKAEPQFADYQERIFSKQLEVEEMRMAADALIGKYEAEEAEGPPDLVKLLDLHNVERAAFGLPPLIGVNALHAAAQKHASWMRENDVVQHTGVGGTQPFARARAEGYGDTPLTLVSVGENAAGGQVYNSQVIKGWMNSPSHRVNILSSKWEHIGLGFSQDSRKNFNTFWVVVFGAGDPQASQGPPGQTEIVFADEKRPPDAIENALIDLQNKTLELKNIQLNAAFLEAEINNVNRQLAQLKPLVEDQKSLEVWSADYALDLPVGLVVGLAEMYGEGLERPAVILPDKALKTTDPRSEWSPSRDGLMQSRQGMTPEQVYANAAILPGWQKFKPMYRRGVVESLDHEANTARVGLIAVSSTAQALNINQAEVLDAVPVSHIWGDSFAFEAGDDVAVRFEDQSWEAPSLIGFWTEPRLPDVLLAFPLLKSITSTRYAELNLCPSLPLPEDGFTMRWFVTQYRLLLGRRRPSLAARLFRELYFAESNAGLEFDPITVVNTSVTDPTILTWNPPLETIEFPAGNDCSTATTQATPYLFEGDPAFPLETRIWFDVNPDIERKKARVVLEPDSLSVLAEIYRPKDGTFGVRKTGTITGELLGRTGTDAIDYETPAFTQMLSFTLNDFPVHQIRVQGARTFQEVPYKPKEFQNYLVATVPGAEWIVIRYEHDRGA
jgi:uncharacterized protein YkwD